jgi:hypothetical protein
VTLAVEVRGVGVHRRIRCPAGDDHRAGAAARPLGQFRRLRSHDRHRDVVEQGQLLAQHALE